ncbi:MFS transporter [Chthonobacter rhizosphaerae]|uniref:MFS transporter n=1 Tax=Chthonobacter rhizosphaerae TaxID=2735553 RepID=UPI0015EFD0A2|nr:MFS transporter [Chthonobacter rhizosphaerae]
MSLPLPLLALAAGAFGIGTTEFVIMGLLPQVAADLGVTIPEAGLLVTGYAVGVVVGAPLLAILTARLPRKGTLLGLMALFVAGNLFCAIAPGYWSLLAARVLTAFAHAAYFGIGAVVAASLVPADRRAQAMALMFMGLTVANILGVPGGTALGQAFGWRATFVAVAAIGVVAFAGVALFVPRALKTPEGDVLKEFRVLRDPQVLLGMTMSAVSAAAFFCTFTYVSPILREVTGLSEEAVTAALFLYGFGLTAGNWIGGRIADWDVHRAIMGVFTAVGLTMAVFLFTAHSVPLAYATLFVWGIVSFAAVAPLQMLVVDSARAAPNLASTLNQGAFNVGCASGAWFGALALDGGLGLDRLPLVGVALTAVGLALSVATWRSARAEPVAAE